MEVGERKRKEKRKEKGLFLLHLLILKFIAKKMDSKILQKGLLKVIPKTNGKILKATRF